MKRKWFNWFGNEAGRRWPRQTRRRLGTGFEAIEPRLLMSRDAQPAVDMAAPAAESGFVDIGTTEMNPLIVIDPVTPHPGDSGPGTSVAPSPLTNVPPTLPSGRSDTPIDPPAAPSGFTPGPTPLINGEQAGPPPSLSPPPPPPPLRVAPPLPDTLGKEGGVIDISPGEERDAELTPVRQPSTRSSGLVAIEKRDALQRDPTATLPLQAARGEAQAFELAYAAWHHPMRALQRVAPPKPDEAMLPATPVAAAKAAMNGSAESAATRSVAAAPPAYHGGRALPTLPHSLVEDPLDSVTAPLDEFEQSLSSYDLPAVDRRDSAPLPQRFAASRALVSEAIDTYARGDSLCIGDADTAARVVGVGLVVMAWQVSVLYVYPERCTAQRTPTRDWQRGLDLAAAQLPPRV